MCIALGIILGRSIQTFYTDIKKKRETKQRQKREEERIAESNESTHFQSTLQSQYQHLGGNEHRGEEIRRNSDYGHDEPNDLFAHSLRTVVSSPLQTLDWLNTEVADPLEDTPPIYDHNATRLPPYERNVIGHGDFSPGGINEDWQPRARACTGMRISEHPGLNLDQGRVVIWYDALEDRYEVISRSLAPPREPPLPPRYMPNCVDDPLI
jgi:hypothetical protein